MKLIAHRGNVNGINVDLENNPGYIDTAIECGYDVELDLWSIENKLFLGHDKPIHKVLDSYLLDRSEYLFIHCKNIQALHHLVANYNSDLHFFWHENDAHTLTNKNIIWNYIDSELTENSICVLPELNRFKGEINKCYGVCSDFIDNYKHLS